MNHKNNISRNMKKIFFAVMAFAVVVLTTGCNKDEDFMKASLSVEEVTEHSIKVRCAYVPQKKDDAGYLLLRSTTDQIDDEMRKELIELYPVVNLNHESGAFACDSLAADRLYYFWAVSYKKQKNGEVTIANIEILSQRTLADNDGEVSYKQEGSSSYYTFTVQLGDEAFSKDLDYLYEIGSAQYFVKVSLTPDTALVAANQIGVNQYYNKENGTMVCRADVRKSSTFVAYKPVSDGMYRKYTFEVISERTKNGYPSVGDGDFAVLVDQFGFVF